MTAKLRRLRSHKDLPFIVEGKWQPEEVEGYALQNRLGRSYADAVIRLAQDSDNPLIFSAVMRAMADAGQFEGVEVGFCHRISELLL
jgi:hypothetical protein